MSPLPSTQARTAADTPSNPAPRGWLLTSDDMAPALQRITSELGPRAHAIADALTNALQAQQNVNAVATLTGPNGDVVPIAVMARPVAGAHNRALVGVTVPLALIGAPTDANDHSLDAVSLCAVLDDNTLAVDARAMARFGLPGPITTVTALLQQIDPSHNQAVQALFASLSGFGGRQSARIAGADGVFASIHVLGVTGDPQTQAPPQLVIVETDERADATTNDKTRERAILALETSGAAVFEWDLTNGRHWWSQAMRAMLGAPADEKADWVGFEARLHPDEQDSVVHAIMSSLEPSSSRMFALEHRLAKACGEHRWVATKGQVTLGPAGQPARLFAVTTDITPRKATELDLLASRARFDEVVRTSGVCVFEIDASGRIRFISDNTSRLYGCHPEALLGRYALALFPGASKDSQRTLITTANSERGVRNHEVQITRPDGETLWLRVNARRRFGADRGFRGWRGSVVDVTRTRSAAVAMRRAEERTAAALAEAKAIRSAIGMTSAPALADVIDALEHTPSTTPNTSAVRTAIKAARDVLRELKILAEFGAFGADEPIQTPSETPRRPDTPADQPHGAPLDGQPKTDAELDTTAASPTRQTAANTEQSHSDLGAIDLIDDAFYSEMLAMTGEDLLFPIIETFFPMAEDHMVKIRNAATADDATELRYHSHSLKGASANVGAVQVAAIARALEAHPADTEALVELLAKAIAATTDEFRDRMRRRGHTD